ncbi:MAG: aminotransferase class V-fold PLP-dependent enzyme [Pseudomonadota bacterium]
MPGRNHLFIPGPTNIPESVRMAMNVPMQDMRAPDFGEFILPLFEDLKKVFKTKDGQVFMFPSSGTGAWEAAVSNTLSPGDKVIVSSFGHFSHLWCDLLERHGLEVVNFDVEWGEGVPLDDYARVLAEDKDHKIKGVFACQNETASGVTSDIAGVRKVLDDCDHPALLYVDGISSIGCIDFRMDEWGVDLAVGGSQKGFMLPTGLGFVGVSQKALAARAQAKLPRTFFDFDDMIKTNATGYFPYTPATTLFHGLKESLRLLLDEGLENVFARHNRIAESVRRAVAAWELDLVARGPEWYSDTVSAIYVPDGFDATEVIGGAYKNYNLSLGTGLARLQGKAFRIGHLGDMNELMIVSAIAGAEMAMRDIGMNIDPGVGVGAATEYLRSSRAANLASDKAA